MRNYEEIAMENLLRAFRNRNMSNVTGARAAREMVRCYANHIRRHREHFKMISDNKS